MASPATWSSLVARSLQVGRHGGLGGAQLQGDRDQALLGAVVQVAFDASAGVIGGGHDALAAGGQVGVELGVVQRDGQLPGDEGDRVEAVGGERAADQPVFQQQHRAQRAAAEDGHGQQRAAGGVGEVGVAGEAVVGGGVGHEQGLLGAVDVAQHGHRGGVFAAVDRGGAAGGGGEPVVVLVAPQQQAHAGGAGHRAEHRGDAGV